MSEFEKNNPLGIASEGLLQNNDPIQVASSGVIKKKKFTYIAKVSVIVGVDSTVEHSSTHESEAQIIIGVSSTEELTYKHNGNYDTTLIVSGEANYSFKPASTEDERGGRGAHTIRKIRKTPQKHIYTWDVGVLLKDTIKVTALSECEFIKVDRFNFIKSINFPVVYDEVPVVRNNVFNFVSDAQINTSISSEVLFTDSIKQNILEEDELIIHLLSEQESPYIISLVSDVFGDKKRKDEQDLFRMLDMI